MLEMHNCDIFITAKISILWSKCLSISKWQIWLWVIEILWIWINKDLHECTWDSTPPSGHFLVISFNHISIDHTQWYHTLCLVPVKESKFFKWFECESWTYFSPFLPKLWKLMSFWYSLSCNCFVSFCRISMFWNEAKNSCYSEICFRK